MLIFVFLTGCSKSGPPYSPKEALKSFKIEPGFRIELFASEPLITSPVAMDVDEQGRIFVVEMPGYPLDTSPSGRVVMLEDTDGDGRPDRRTVFADRLVLPTGVMRWKKGILVTAAPNVWYFEDTDGDGRADVRRVVLTGFPFTNPQHTVNSPVYGLDNWIYLAHEPPATAVIFKEKFGDRGSDIRFPDRSDVPPARVGRNIRFHPDKHLLEALSGSSQFGHAFDVWGHHFTLNNSNHIRHEVIAARYLKRNPDLPLPTAMQDMSDHGVACKVFPITHNPQHQMLTEVGQITSACSLTPYLGGASSPVLEGVSLVAEPAHNLVHEDVWSPSGSSFIARRARNDAEFLASTDSWFRPVNFYIGPDGAIYVLDYYRQIIEHPEWMSSEHHHHDKNLYKGSDKGRIYRIVADSSAAAGTVETHAASSSSSYAVKPGLPKDIRLDKASDEELVRQLGNPNIWWRRTAQRLLVDRQGAGAVEPLARLFKETKSPVARAHVLWTLDGLGKLDAELIGLALQDPEPGVRENAIRLAEPRLSDGAKKSEPRPVGGVKESEPRPSGSGPSDESPRLRRAGSEFLHRLSGPAALTEKLLKMTDDPDPQVRFQLLCTLGFLDSEPSRAAQEKLLFEDFQDEWMQVAALSASSDRAPQWFKTAVSRLASASKGQHLASPAFSDNDNKAYAAFLKRICSVIAARKRPAEIRSVIDAVSRNVSSGLEEWRAASLQGLSQGLRMKGGVKPSAGSREPVSAAWGINQSLLLEMFQKPNAPLRRAALELLEAVGLSSDPSTAVVLRKAAATALEKQSDPQLRADSIRLLTLGDIAPQASWMKTLVDPREPEQVQAAAVRALGRIPGEAVGAFLLGKWRTMTPAVRNEAGDTLFREPGRVRLLLNAIKSGDVPPWTLIFRDKRRLLMHDDPAIRDNARALLVEKSEDRDKVLRRYRAALEISGDLVSGKHVFEQNCVKCHQRNGVGGKFGPDLATVQNRTPDALLADILIPSQSIAQNYEMYVVELANGTTIEGILSADTPTAITLRHEDGREDVISRQDIEDMYASTISAMPTELEKQIDLHQMADLLAYVKSRRF